MERSRRRKAVVSWSTGKDAAHALARARRSSEFEIVGLLTTYTEAFGRVSMHGVRVGLLRAQADALDLPLHLVPIPYPCPNDVYESRMATMVARLHEMDVTAIVFGDIHLRDVRAYRESKLEGTGIAPVFPLWGENSRSLAREMVRSGLRATLVCVDPRRLPASFAGREFDERLLADLPPEVDPCGENGEFHTFVHGSPEFRRAVHPRPGEVVVRDGFVFADLLVPDPPTDSAAGAESA